MDGLRALIRDVPDFPAPGIVFKDITPLLADPKAFAETVDLMAEPWSGDGITHVVGIEARGFILGSPLALRLGAGFVPIRKPGRLPAATLRREYLLEYGTDALEVHADAFTTADRVLVVDDVLATGGTGSAAVTLVSMLGAEVIGFGVLVELGLLEGRERIPVVTEAVIRYG